MKYLNWKKYYKATSIVLQYIEIVLLNVQKHFTRPLNLLGHFNLGFLSISKRRIMSFINDAIIICKHNIKNTIKFKHLVLRYCERMV